MKFIKSGDRHYEYDSFEEVNTSDETSKPRWIPSYYDSAKKQSSRTAGGSKKQ